VLLPWLATRCIPRVCLTRLAEVYTLLSLGYVCAIPEDDGVHAFMQAFDDEDEVEPLA
jgi:hypothetical protein